MIALDPVQLKLAHGLILLLQGGRELVGAVAACYEVIAVAAGGMQRRRNGGLTRQRDGRGWQAVDHIGVVGSGVLKIGTAQVAAIGRAEAVDYRGVGLQAHAGAGGAGRHRQSASALPPSRFPSRR